MAELRDEAFSPEGLSTEFTLEAARALLADVKLQLATLLQHTDGLEGQLATLDASVVGQTGILQVELAALRGLVDGLEGTLGSTADPATALTVIGLLKHAKQQLDIPLTALRDGLRGASSRDLSTLQAAVEATTLAVSSAHSAIVTAVGGVQSSVDSFKTAFDARDLATETTLAALRARADLLGSEGTLAALRVEAVANLLAIYARQADGSQNARIRDVAGTLINPRREDGHGASVQAPSHMQPVGRLANGTRLEDKAGVALWTRLANFAANESPPPVWMDIRSYEGFTFHATYAGGAFVTASLEFSNDQATVVQTVALVDRRGSYLYQTTQRLGDYVRIVLVKDAVASTSFLGALEGHRVAPSSPILFSLESEFTDQDWNVPGFNAIRAVDTSITPNVHRRVKFGARPANESLPVIPASDDKEPLLSFVQALSGSGSYETQWVRADNAQWLDFLLQLAPTQAVAAQLHETDSNDPNVTPPGAGDIVRIASMTLAGSTLGGLDIQSIGLPTIGKWVKVKVTNAAGSGTVKAACWRVHLPPTGAQLPLAAGLTKDLRAPIGRTVIAAFKPDGSSINAQADVNGNLLVSNIPKPVSDAPGRVHYTITISAAIVNTLLHTVAPGRRFRVTHETVTASNTSTLDPGGIILRDGTGVAGEIKLPLSFGRAVAGAVAPSLDMNGAVNDPPIYATGIFLHLSSGALTVSVRLEGYEENV